MMAEILAVIQYSSIPRTISGILCCHLAKQRSASKRICEKNGLTNLLNLMDPLLNPWLSFTNTESEKRALGYRSEGTF